MVNETQKNKAIAVLSGDIIRSTELPHEVYEDLLYTLHNQLTLVCDYHPENEFELSRGDAFQVLLHDPENAAKYALLIRTALRGQNEHYDCRISIGIGNDYSLRHTVSRSTGDAFTLSGRTLDDMATNTLKITTPNESFNECFALLTKYLDQQISEMTERQCAITHLILKADNSLTQAEIANSLGAKRVSINRSMKTANLNLIMEYLSLFSKKVEAFFL
ncbi:hypothetical protein [Alteromonas sp. a30]|uniref:hypothetical protein n=1 Tax=Alteromonas sp. a30 TaxID=2730917 RepID=UPI0022830F3D|nr:hypothetical protein [Alteromonas sp. a30]MCY7296631.1 hypothetical protein [Alteromonas sp. a30]